MNQHFIQAPIEEPDQRMDCPYCEDGWYDPRCADMCPACEEAWVRERRRKRKEMPQC